MADHMKLVEVLKGHKVYIQTHNFPDPDAIASAYGLKVFLHAFEIEADICYDGKIDKNSTKRMIDTFGIKLTHIDDIKNMGFEDYIVTVDAQKYNSNITDFPGDEVACIDHHPTVIPCAYKYSDVRLVGACASLIAEYFVKSNMTMDTTTATILLYGMKMDTDSFSRGVTALDIEMFSYLHAIADNKKISDLYSNSMELDDLRAYGEAIKNIEIYENIGFAYIPFDCPDALIAMISEFILDLDVVEFSVVFAARNGGLKFSVRNETAHFHAGKITSAALFDLGGGGGHFAMAGGIVTAENMEKLGSNLRVGVRNTFLEAIKNNAD